MERHPISHRKAAVAKNSDEEERKMDWELLEAEYNAREDLDWIKQATPHVVALVAAFIRMEYEPDSAVTRAVRTYTKIEHALINATANK
jgi:hypothetical protein